MHFWRYFTKYNISLTGRQLINIIPNSDGMTNKLGLLASLQAYDRISRKAHLRSTDFLPQTYSLDDPIQQQAFLQQFQGISLLINI